METNNKCLDDVFEIRYPDEVTFDLREVNDMAKRMLEMFAKILKQ